MPTIGAILAQARTRLGMSQAALASEVGCSPSYISHLESDRRPRMSLGIAGRIARTLGLTPTEIARIVELAAEEASTDA